VARERRMIGADHQGLPHIHEALFGCAFGTLCC
jgi:hypothetical protein